MNLTPRKSYGRFWRVNENRKFRAGGIRKLADMEGTDLDQAEKLRNIIKKRQFIIAGSILIITGIYYNLYNYYLNLNGKWDYTITNEFRISDIDNYKFDKIIVPYPLESKLSNVGIRLPKDHFLVYKKEFCFHNKLNRTILHIGACSSETMVFLNNKALFTLFRKCPLLGSTNLYIPFLPDSHE